MDDTTLLLMSLLNVKKQTKNGRKDLISVDQKTIYTFVYVK